MPVKRRLSKVRALRITPEAVELFVKGRAIIAAGAIEAWEADGGRRREYLDTGRELHNALGLFPHEANPLDVEENPNPPTWSNAYSQSWHQAVELHGELAKAAGLKL